MPVQEPVRVTTNPGPDGSPIWHPDGERIGYITSYTDRNDVPASYLQTKVAIIRIGADEPVLLTTEDLDRKAYGPQFSPDGNTIYAMLEDDGRVDLVAVSVADGELSRLVSGQVRVEDIEVAPDGSVVVAISKPRLPGDLFVLDAEPSASPGLRRLTDVNGELLSSIWLSDVEELRFPTLDGTEIQTFVYKPQDFNQNRKYPAILWLHGGQESQYDYGFNFRVQLFAANGYVVVMPNVRGSGGRGLEFALSLNKAYGTDDVEDVIVATDYVIEQGYVDPDRLGVGGWSSGWRDADELRDCQDGSICRRHKWSQRWMVSDHLRSRSLLPVVAYGARSAVEKSRSLGQHLTVHVRRKYHHADALHRRRKRLESADHPLRADVPGDEASRSRGVAGGVP